ncbi:hypothetical protein pdam_00004806 [Pocillopora damicornis]|uniref:Uncharacterized protein n=1 Tax=Pocillopora damicornis TaxID=46731 RepID=A0A3M6U962_POCDA|nr:hypothetical protein pdam_00004806 [Pocillopora damicornis]
MDKDKNIHQETPLMRCKENISNRREHESFCSILRINSKSISTKQSVPSEKFSKAMLDVNPKTVRRITNEILRAKVLKKASYTPSADMKSSITSSAKLLVTNHLMQTRKYSMKSIDSSKSSTYFLDVLAERLHHKLTTTSQMEVRCSRGSGAATTVTHKALEHLTGLPNLQPSHEPPMLSPNKHPSH